MDDIVFAGNRALYLILVMSAGPIAVATFVGLLVGLFSNGNAVAKNRRCHLA